MSGSLEWLSNRSYAVEDAFNQQCGQEIHCVYLKSADDVQYAYTPTNMLHALPSTAAMCNMLICVHRICYMPCARAATNMLHALPAAAGACDMLACLQHSIVLHAN